MYDLILSIDITLVKYSHGAIAESPSLTIPEIIAYHVVAAPPQYNLGFKAQINTITPGSDSCRTTEVLTLL